MQEVVGELGYIHSKGRFARFVPKVTWDDVVRTIDSSYQNQIHSPIENNVNKDTHHNVHSHNYQAPYLAIYDPLPVGTIARAFREVSSRETRLNNMDVYVSLSSVGEANGRHNDDHDVLIVQAIGSTSYRFDDDYVATMAPGDSLYIPAFVYHEPIAHSPRVNLSFGLD